MPTPKTETPLHRVTKKAKILSRLNENIVIDDGTKRFKILSKNDFRDMGLGSTIEYGERYCDIIYAQQLLRKLGYRVLLGSMCMYVHETENKKL